jgi:nucleotide-binding universal stress UspA family protein
VARYLVVAHQTADSPELIAELQRAKASDPASTFVLLVPATPVQHLGGWTEGESREVAAQAGERAQKKLERHGIRLSEIRVGDADPVEAACDEWNERPDYDEVILSTLPARTSRWLKADASNRLAKRLTIPVRHVVAEARN